MSLPGTNVGSGIVIPSSGGPSGAGDERTKSPDVKMHPEQQAVLNELERKRKSRQIAVSTDDNEVKKQLREEGEPICLFGEGPAERRERLRRIIYLQLEGGKKKKKVDKEIKLEGKKKGEVEKPSASADLTWYHEGTEHLRRVRHWIAEYSIPRALNRLEEARQNKESLASVRQELCKKVSQMEITGSQVGDSRPISCVKFSPTSNMIATSSWTGQCRLWSMPNLDHVRTLRGHNAQTCSVAWHPQATKTLDESVVNLASSGVDGSVLLWDLKHEEAIFSLKGHEPNRVAQVEFHPSGRFLATTCYDSSWRLWDLETQIEMQTGRNEGPNEEVLFQEGHTKAVHAVSFHPDGSLVGTGGLDSYGRVWDLRTGRCIMFMEGHLKGILSICISPNGYHIVTGSEDHSIKVWNLRERKCEYTIPAHTNIISKVIFGVGGHFIASSSYDNTIKLWNHPGWTPIKTLQGHDNKVMGIDFCSQSRDSPLLASSSFDRTFKLWSCDFF